jgi:V/A-type H+/Na+-transporting ATPase subunit D
MAQIIRVRPTKIELVKLKRRLALATRVQNIVKDRLSILTMEFLQSARDTVKAKERLIEAYSIAYKALSFAVGYHGYVALEKDLVATETDIKVTFGSRHIAGVKISSFDLEERQDSLRGYDLIDTSAWLDLAAKSYEECLKAAIDLAETQSSMELLGAEINKVKRITNALEYLIIPSLQLTIKYLNMKFEERDREEKTRLKRVKVLLAREQANV